MRFFGNIFAWIIAVLVAYVAGSAFSTQFVLGGLGVPISLSERLTTTIGDVGGFYAYAIVIAIGFFLAFIIASLVKAVLPVLAPVAYPIAGAAAIAAALGLMFMQFGQMPVSGARSELGLIFQYLAGGIGGLAFEFFRPK